MAQLVLNYSARYGIITVTERESLHIHMNMLHLVARKNNCVLFFCSETAQSKKLAKGVNDRQSATMRRLGQPQAR